MGLNTVLVCISQRLLVAAAVVLLLRDGTYLRSLYIVYVEILDVLTTEAHEVEGLVRSKDHVALLDSRLRAEASHFVTIVQIWFKFC